MAVEQQRQRLAAGAYAGREVGDFQLQWFDGEVTDDHRGGGFFMASCQETDFG